MSNLLESTRLLGYELISIKDTRSIVIAPNGGSSDEAKGTVFQVFQLSKTPAAAGAAAAAVAVATAATTPATSGPKTC